MNFTPNAYSHGSKNIQHAQVMTYSVMKWATKDVATEVVYSCLEARDYSKGLLAI